MYTELVRELIREYLGVGLRVSASKWEVASAYQTEAEDVVEEDQGDVLV